MAEKKKSHLDSIPLSRKRRIWKNPFNPGEEYTPKLTLGVASSSEIRLQAAGAGKHYMKEALKKNNLGLAVQAIQEREYAGRYVGPFYIDGLKEVMANQRTHGDYNPLETFAGETSRILRKYDNPRSLVGTAVAASIVGLVGGIFFLSPNLTGNAIANLSKTTSSGVGVILLLVGLVAGLFWVKSSKK